MSINAPWKINPNHSEIPKRDIVTQSAYMRLVWFLQKILKISLARIKGIIPYAHI